MIFVGGSVGVSGTLAGAPALTAQAIRYAFASALLIGYARRIPRPRGTEYLWLAGVAATGLALFNIALVQGARHAEPAVLGVAVSCVPLLFALIGRPRFRVLAAAALVTAGAALVQGMGRSDGVGLGYAVVVFGCEAAFTLLAVPVLGRLGPIGVSIHTTWMAAAGFAIVGLVREGPAAAVRLSASNWLAIAYLAIAVTAVAFLLWYTCVMRLTAARAGLLTGIAPISAAATGVLLGAPIPAVPVWMGVMTVAAGLVLGLRTPIAGTRGRKYGSHGRPDVSIMRTCSGN
jgi:drug/metabolite transporter (DMT)-like permease